MYKDVYEKKCLSREAYNPLNPKFKIRDENGNIIDYGEIKGS